MLKITIPGAIEKLIEALLILFGIFIIIQILIKLSGGSWSTEDIILSLLIFNIGATFTIGIMLAQLKSDHNHLKTQFKSLANDFKEHNKKSTK